MDTIMVEARFGFRTWMNYKEIAKNERSVLTYDKRVIERNQRSNSPRADSATGLARRQVSDTNAKIGAHREGETPVPMPNTEAKPLIGYNT